MNLKGLKKAIAGALVALTLIFSVGITGSTAQAQNRDRDRRGDRNRDRDRDGRRDSDWQRRQQIQRARELAWWRQRERARNRDSYRYQSRRNYPYYGSSGSYGRYGGYSSGEEQRGFRNGLKEGADDARDRDSFNPNRHSSFRDGNGAYREGFHRGYVQGYRQFAGYRGW